VIPLAKLVVLTTPVEKVCEGGPESRTKRGWERKAAGEAMFPAPSPTLKDRREGMLGRPWGNGRGRLVPSAACSLRKNPSSAVSWRQRLGQGRGGDCSPPPGPIRLLMSGLTKEVGMYLRFTKRGAANRVARAAAWLDKNYPGWAKKIPLTHKRFRIDQGEGREFIDGEYKVCGCLTVHTGINPDVFPKFVGEATCWQGAADQQSIELLQTEWEDAIRERKGLKRRAAA
jgi:hypothetical protein